MADQVLLTVDEAAEALSLSRTKVYELIAGGALDSVTVGRCRRLRPEALVAFVEELARDAQS